MFLEQLRRELWQHLFQFPLHEDSKDLDSDEIKQITGLSSIKNSAPITHVLSHQRIYARFHHFNEIPLNFRIQGEVIKKNELDSYALPRLIDRYLQENGW